MTTSPKLAEKHLYEIWKKQQFTKSLLSTSGEEITILDFGLDNHMNAGPDFINARMRIGNLTYVGDIEIDLDYRDWKTHGHNIDSKFNKVILHLALNNQYSRQYVYTKEGRKVPTVCLINFISDEQMIKVDKELKQPSYRETQLLRCSSLNESIPLYIKKEYLSKLGLERFNKKCKKIHHRLKELAWLKELHSKEPIIQYDLGSEFQNKEFTYQDFKDKQLWDQILYELVFEALGYSKNKTIMLNLAQAVKIDMLRKLGHDEEFFDRMESTMFHVGGLIPQSISNNGREETLYLDRLKKQWEYISRIYDGKTFNSSLWHFHKLRPQNFPTIRIAGGVKIIRAILYEDLIATLIKKIVEIRNLTVLINSIRSLFVVKSFGYWKSHYIFGKAGKSEVKYFIGASRADEILNKCFASIFRCLF